MKALKVLLAAAAAFAVGLASAQFPNKPIKIVVSNPPGGQTFGGPCHGRGHDVRSRPL